MAFIIFQANWEIVFAYPFKDENLHTFVSFAESARNRFTKSIKLLGCDESIIMYFPLVNPSIKSCWTSIWKMIFLGGSWPKQDQDG